MPLFCVVPIRLSRPNGTKLHSTITFAELRDQRLKTKTGGKQTRLSMAVPSSSSAELGSGDHACGFVPNCEILPGGWFCDFENPWAYGNANSNLSKAPANPLAFFQGTDRCLQWVSWDEREQLPQSAQTANTPNIHMKLWLHMHPQGPRSV